jgi:N-acetylmuramoyl-L-alanine amidase
MYEIQNNLLCSRTGSNDFQSVPFFSSPNTTGRQINPRFLVIHFTAGPGDATKTAQYFQKKAAKTSAHLNLGQEGQWTQSVKLNVQAWHAGKSSWSGTNNLNNHSIGIEVCNPGPLTITSNGYKAWWGAKIDDPDIIEAPHSAAPKGEVFGWQPFTESQVEALIDVGQLLMEQYGLEECVGHDMIAPGRKRDPGPCMNYRVYEQINAATDNPDSHWQWYVSNVKTSLNGRAGPGTSYEIVAELPKGTAIDEILAKEGMWWQVELENGQELWVHRKFLGKQKINNA